MYRQLRKESGNITEKMYQLAKSKGTLLVARTEQQMQLKKSWANP